MYKFNDLLKASSKEVSGSKIKISVLGNCSTQFFSKCIQGNCRLEGLNVDVFDADYNQIDLQLIQTNSEVYESKPDIIVLWIASEKLYEDFLELSFEDRSHFSDNWINKIKQYWEMIKANSTSKVFMLNFAEINDLSLGNLSSSVDTTFINQIRRLNSLLNEEIQHESNVFLIDLSSIQNTYGRSSLFDPVLYYSSKTPVALNAIPFVTQRVADCAKSITGKIKKCLIMDLDNTIWGGVIGDDGLNNIEIGHLKRGHVFTNLQKWIKELKENGIILAVCSKNNPDIAKEPFEKHSEMVLRLSDISIFVANWDDKVSNIKLIQETLNIGMDSIVFIDDNPFERNLVREMIPQITVPELPDDPACYLDYLIQLNLFETSINIKSGIDRTSQYQAQFERKKLEMSFDSIDDYLKSLDMECEIRPFEEKRFARISELSQRSNQFNLRTIRYTEEDIKRIANDDRFLTLSFSLKDKFGDYGLVGVVILEKKETGSAFVDTWFMSCRALKRGLEEKIVNSMIDVCKQHDISKLYAEFIPTAKNNMVKDIYSRFGFKEIKENQFCIDVNLYQYKNNYIKEV